MPAESGSILADCPKCFRVIWANAPCPKCGQIWETVFVDAVQRDGTTVRTPVKVLRP